ncbi:hypothetical protein GY45DRAFT_1326183 [Cubamyces sp. BRFM 1775]|nr:hypothetical protein GY45DRAFT_1326183 [Cubamyces sp. BRFM 1775]
MEDVMDASMDYNPSAQHIPQAMHERYEAPVVNNPSTTTVLTEMDRLYEQMRSAIASAAQPREPIRDIPVKVHIRRPERDSWAYMGRGIVSQEITGQSSRVVVRSASSHKILTVFGEGTALQAERRGNFVVIGCVEGSRVVSWSLNALNHAETVRLLASIELAAYACKQAMADPSLHSAIRRRIARVIKDDRRRRHKRRKDQDAMVAAFARTGLVDSGSGSNSHSNSNSNAVPSAYAPSFPSAASAPPPTEPVPVPAPVPMPVPEPAMPAAPGQAPGGLYMGMQPEL